MSIVYITPCYNVFISLTGHCHDSRTKEAPAEKEAGKEVIYSIIVIAFIIIVLVRAGVDDKRVFPIMTVMWMTTLSYLVYYFGSYDSYVEMLGYYAYHSIWLLTTIAILSFMRGKLAFCLMGLFCFEIVVNACYFLIEGAGIYADTFYQLMQWLLYGVEVSLLFSRRLTDGVYGVLCKNDLARDFAESRYHGHYRTRSVEDISREKRA